MPITNLPCQGDVHWMCSLCNIELPNDEMAVIRKERHAEFHIDESVGTTNRQRNWTFGKAEFELMCERVNCIVCFTKNTLTKWRMWRDLT